MTALGPRPPAPGADAGDDASPPRSPVRTVDPLARALGWVSVALGVALVVAPGRVARLAGMGPAAVARPVTRAVGVRQMASGVGILASRRPVGWLWARAAGDAVDLVLLAAGAAVQGRGRHVLGRRLAHHRRPSPGTVAAMVVAGSLGLVDQVAAVRLTRRRGPHRTASVAVTIDQPRDVVYRRWRELQDFPRFMTHLDLRPARTPVTSTPDAGGVGWDADVVNEVPGELIEWRSSIASDVDHAGTVRFEPGPGGRGTRVTVRVDYRPPGGLLGSLVAGLFGEHPRQQIIDDLLRFKHVFESPPG
jgi:uncharacterized membrane protein